MTKKNFIYSIPSITNMKKFKFLAILAMALFTMGTVCACSSGDDDGDGGSGSSLTELVGTWYGTNDTWDFWYTFNSNGTGSGEGHSKRGSEYRWTYTYTCNGNTIKCKGASVNVSFGGDIEENKNWETTFTLSGTTLTGGQFRGVTFEKQ